MHQESIYSTPLIVYTHFELKDRKHEISDCIGNIPACWCYIQEFLDYSHPHHSDCEYFTLFYIIHPGASLDKNNCVHQYFYFKNAFLKIKIFHISIVIHIIYVQCKSVIIISITFLNSTLLAPLFHQAV